MGDPKVSKKELSRRLELFKSEVLRFQVVLGHADVEITVSWLDDEECERSRATWVYDTKNMMVFMKVSRPWLMRETIDREISKVAFHEVYESQFQYIYEELEHRLNDEAAQNLVHTLVRRAENVVFPLLDIS